MFAVGQYFMLRPIVRQKAGGSGYEMISVGLYYQYAHGEVRKEFVQRTGVRIIVGEGRHEAKILKRRAVNTGHCIVSSSWLCCYCSDRGRKRLRRLTGRSLVCLSPCGICKVKNFGPSYCFHRRQRKQLFEKNKIEFNRKRIWSWKKCTVSFILSSKEL